MQSSASIVWRRILSPKRGSRTGARESWQLLPRQQLQERNYLKWSFLPRSHHRGSRNYGKRLLMSKFTCIWAGMACDLYVLDSISCLTRSTSRQITWEGNRYLLISSWSFRVSSAWLLSRKNRSFLNGWSRSLSNLLKTMYPAIF